MFLFSFPAIGGLVAVGFVLSQLLFLRRVLDAEEARVARVHH